MNAVRTYDPAQSSYASDWATARAQRIVTLGADRFVQPIEEFIADSSVKCTWRSVLTGYTIARLRGATSFNAGDVHRVLITLPPHLQHDLVVVAGNGRLITEADVTETYRLALAAVVTVNALAENGPAFMDWLVDRLETNAHRCWKAAR
jgi:hypothetical protein